MPFYIWKFAFKVYTVLDQKLDDRVYIPGVILGPAIRHIAVMMALVITMAEEQMPNTHIVVHLDVLVWIVAMI